jgi:signal transduction histidine kinase
MHDEEKENLKKINKQLHEAKDGLEQLNHFKTHLLALTSHQIKTPLGIIRGYATLLREGFYGAVTDQQKEILSKMEFATEDVVNLIDNLIDLRKIEEGRIQYQMNHFDFVKIARQAAQEMGHMAMSKGLDLSFSGPETPLMIYGDEQKLRHVIQNLIDNAVKYTEKGSIKLTVEDKGKQVELMVSDTGLGIPHKIIPLLFEEFTREERMQKIRGTGMGLHIAKIFVEEHKGKIWATSDGENKGSKFFIELPKE